MSRGRGRRRRYAARPKCPSLARRAASSCPSQAIVAPSKPNDTASVVIATTDMTVHPRIRSTLQCNRA